MKEFILIALSLFIAGYAAYPMVNWYREPQARPINDFKIMRSYQRWFGIR